MRLRALLFVLFAGAAMAPGQSPAGQYNGNFHAFANFGACQHGYGLFGGGGGAEGLVWKGLSVGVDGSYQSFTDGYGFTFLTLQTGYHFVNRKRPLKWDPFVTVGTGMVFGAEGGVGPAANLGGGATYWVRPRLGVRFEFRVHGMAEELMTTGRIGISFR